MATLRHRDSLMSLFDPLARPHTPPRNTASPDSASDKENDNPKPGPLTEFFNRIYKVPQAVELPKGKLIDVSDLSISLEGVMDDSVDLIDLEGDEETHDRVEDKDADADASAPARFPLAELKLDKPSSSEVTAPSTVDDELEQPAVVISFDDKPASILQTLNPAPYGTPLADVINSINLSAIGFVEADTTDDPPCPGIMVSPPTESASLPEASSPISATHLSPEAPPKRRHNVSTHANDPRRVSVDLHASFSLQMQSTELSFDLLNDKISFEAHGDADTYSFGDIGEDDTLDFGKNCGKALQTVAEDTFDLTKEAQMIEAAAQMYGTIHEEELQTVEEAAQAAVLNSPRHESKMDKESAFKLPLIFSPPSHSQTSSPKEQVAQATAAAAAAIPVIFTPVIKAKETSKVTQSRSSLAASSASGKLPALLTHPDASLSLAKPTPPQSTTEVAARRTRSGSSSSSSASSRSRSSSVAEAPSQPTVSSKPAQAVRGVQRPPEGVAAPLTTTKHGSMRAVSAAQRLSSTAPRPSLSSRMSMAALRRPSLTQAVPGKAPSSSMSLQRPAASAVKGLTSASAVKGPPSAPAAKIPALSVQRPGLAEKTSGLPARLPRPASRLPTSNSSGSRSASISVPRPSGTSVPRSSSISVSRSSSTNVSRSSGLLRKTS